MNIRFDYSGQVFLVTGAARGIGAAIAERAASAGATVILNDLSEAALANTVAKLRARGHDVSDACFDVSDESSVVNAIAAIIEAHGKIDVLVSCAGIQHREPSLSLRGSDFRRMLDVNLFGHFLLAREAGRRMVESANGRIVLVASNITAQGRPGLAPYASAKSGLLGLMHTLAAEWGPQGVTVNAVSPGFVETELTATLHRDPEFNRRVVERTPVRRWGSADDIANAVLYLASEESSFVNGHALLVDGGLTMAF